MIGGLLELLNALVLVGGPALAHFDNNYSQTPGGISTCISWMRTAYGTLVMASFFCELVAQSVEQRTFNAWVLGSIPSELTIPASHLMLLLLGKPRVISPF